MKLLRSLFLSSLLAGSSLAYGQSWSEEIKFANYLIKQELNYEAITQLKLMLDIAPDRSCTDSLYFLIGKRHYWEKELDQSIAAFQQFNNPDYSFFDESRYFMGLNLAYQSKYERAIASVKMATATEHKTVAFQKLQLAAYSLLIRDFDGFLGYSKGFEGVYFEFAEEEQSLLQTYLQIKKRGNKSALLAAGMSAILPGSGKIYAGKAGEGIFNMAVAALFVVQGLEAYNKAGADSPRFIVSSAMFGAFYLANIWGSAIAVKRYKNEFDEAVTQSILLDVHIPLRRLYP